MLSVGDRRHSINKTNNLDPDDGNSWVCSVCKLPIFATPCTQKKTLLLGDHNTNNQQTCSECSQICGSKLYSCPDSDCGLVLDVACALPVKILHRSHEHQLVAVRSSGARSSSHATCGICHSAHDDVIHVNCATSDPHTFKPVAMRKAIFPNLVHLPFQDKHDSFVRYAATQDSSPFRNYKYTCNNRSDHVDYRDIPVSDDDYRASVEWGGVDSPKFDLHPLKLTTAAAVAVDIEEMMICEICEQGIESGVWSYSCSQCEQWFHIDCIPCLELTYKIKSLADSGVDNIRVPTRLIRGLTLEGHGHDYCARLADEYDILAFD